jgi:cytidyltransferase-like protein
MLEFAKSKGDYLVVGIDSDIRVRESKGKERPFNNESARKQFLESIKFVDEVVIFSSDTELISCLSKSKIDLIVVGEEYKGRVIGSNACDVEFFPRIDGFSTTKILNGIKPLD